jgi:flagellin-like hook-associated protein FlgL
MQINTDVSTEAAASVLLTRSDANAQTSTQSSSSTSAQADSQIDPSLQRLTDNNPAMEGADWEIQDEAGAEKASSFASLSIMNHPGTAMTSQANQLSQNVLGLLQPID